MEIVKNSMFSNWHLLTKYRQADRVEYQATVSTRTLFNTPPPTSQTSCIDSVVGKSLKQSTIGRILMITVLLLGGSLLGCSTPARYVEEYQIKNLKVVFLDAQSLHDEWEKRTGQQGVRFLPKMTSGMPAIKTLRGFYDFSTDTLYCPKWNFEVCGHELHHAVLGQFHANH